MDKLAEGGVQMENSDLAFAEELSLNSSNPGKASGAPCSRTTSYISTVRVKDLEEDHVVHPIPCMRRHGRVNEDVVVEGVAVKSQQDLITPARILC